MDNTQSPPDLRDRLIRVETKLDVLISSLSDVRVDHEGRIRRLEKAVYVAAGIAAASGGIAGSVASAFWS